MNQFGIIFENEIFCYWLYVYYASTLNWKEKRWEKTYVYCPVIEIAMGCWNEQNKNLFLSWNLYMYKINYWKMLLFSDTFYLVMDFE